ncbi:hypothetical protein GCK72_007947 [Caenorhabditis remanei]|uniref:C-type lectin domain-containing protein n=1 Tax=Caenorhabditis remanei TaxID=31234 RepID=A0A6A5HMU9_CAERE|nr:hypothetical protein GCK72_007947 [Caenorhabditis remanei]KAF1767986.1 hypothetical protein GCK72_007947 [Caenorhabditis remanei]
MVSYCLLPVLFILAIGFNRVTGENLEEVPCEEETTTRTSIPSITPTTTPTTTTTVARTTTANACANVRAAVSPYLRQNGFWCSMLVHFGAGSTNWFEYENARGNCVRNKLVVSSMETDEEKTDFIKLIQETVLYNLTALWVGASLNTTTQQYYWDDGLAVKLMDPQPIIEDPEGHVAWFINLNSSVPGYGDFRVVSRSGKGPPKVNAYLCGALGVRFN